MAAKKETRGEKYTPELPFGSRAKVASTTIRGEKTLAGFAKQVDLHPSILEEFAEHTTELGTVAPGSGDLFLVRPLAARRLKRGALDGKIVVVGRYAGIAAKHVAKLHRNTRQMQPTFTTGAAHRCAT